MVTQLCPGSSSSTQPSELPRGHRQSTHQAQGPMFWAQSYVRSVSSSRLSLGFKGSDFKVERMLQAHHRRLGTELGYYS